MPGQELIFELRVEGQEAPVPVFLLEGMGLEEARAVVTREVWWKVFVKPALSPDPHPNPLPGGEGEEQRERGKGTDGGDGRGGGAVGDGGGVGVVGVESARVVAGVGRDVATAQEDGGAGGADAAVVG
jgi:hypothetical protein